MRIKNTVAFCWASGEVEFSDVQPKSSLRLASGDESALKSVFSAILPKSALNPNGYLIPQVASAPQKDKLAVACRFRHAIYPALQSAL